MSNFKGIYYYKLISDYPDDVTKNCKLTVEDIDSNFYNLKSADIKSVRFNDDYSQLILTRNDNQEIIADIDRAFLTEDEINVDWDSVEGKITITWGDNTAIIDGLVTNENALKSVNHDYTLSGDGTRLNPLRLAEVEKTGAYAPVINLVDELPEEPKLGDRYLTYEELSDYGYLYNAGAMEEVQSKLNESGTEWRIPTKADWDKLLNYLEPCEYQNHNKKGCYDELGKYAGIMLKSRDDWKEAPIISGTTEDGLAIPPIDPKGLDKYGFTALPAGYGEEDLEPSSYTKTGRFWTTTKQIVDDSEGDYYLKIFDFNRSGVGQRVDCQGYYSIRLVKDYTGSNFYGSETIEGNTYKTVLFNGTSQIWTTINLSLELPEGTMVPNGGEIDKRKAYYINVFNGEGWDKKIISEGDTIICVETDNSIETETEKYRNQQYRVFIDENGDQKLIAVDDVIYDRVVSAITPELEELSERIDQEVADREQADTELSDRIDAEEEARIASDEAINARIDEEIERATSAEAALREDLNAEISARTQADEEINARIDQEIADRTAADEALDAKIDAEIERAISAETALREDLNAEISARTQADEEINARIDQEIADREQADAELSDRIDAEEAARIEQDAILHAQLIDNPENSENENTPEMYVISANSGEDANITLFSKGGTNDIKIYVDGNYGELPSI